MIFAARSDPRAIVISATAREAIAQECVSLKMDQSEEIIIADCQLPIWFLAPNQSAIGNRKSAIGFFRHILSPFSH
jgi:hypothetical protein